MCICSSLCAFPRRRSATNSGSRNQQLKDAIRWNRNSQVDNSPDQAKTSTQPWAAMARSIRFMTNRGTT